MPQRRHHFSLHKQPHLFGSAHRLQAALGVPGGMPGQSGWVRTSFCVQNLGEIVWFARDRAVALRSKPPDFSSSQELTPWLNVSLSVPIIAVPVGCH